jgi:hypothetical protein
MWHNSHSGSAIHAMMIAFTAALLLLQVSSVMPAIGTNTNVKTTQCFCDFRNTVSAMLPANSNEVYRCAAYCQ